jgi:hypothetical protein
MRKIIYIIFILFIFFCSACDKDSYFSGKIETDDIDTAYITCSTALCKGFLKVELSANNVNYEIIETGILYSTDSIFIQNITQTEYNSNDSIFTSSHVGEGRFSCVLKNLKSSTIYFIRAYASIKYNQETTYRIYGNIKSFSTILSQDEINSILLTPTNLTAQQYDDYIVLNWNAGINNTNHNLQWYYVEKSDAIDGIYSKISEPYTNYYTDNNPIEGINYYRICAVIGYPELQSKYVYEQCDFKSSGTTPSIDTPEITSVTKENNQIKIIWNKVDNATDYYIYRGTNSVNFSSEPIGRVGDVDYYIDNVPNSETNCYKIKAYNFYESDFSNVECCIFN